MHDISTNVRPGEVTHFVLPIQFERLRLFLRSNPSHVGCENRTMAPRLTLKAQPSSHGFYQYGI